MFVILYTLSLLLLHWLTEKVSIIALVFAVCSNGKQQTNAGLYPHVFIDRLFTWN